MRPNLNLFYIVFCGLLYAQQSYCWDNEELEIFDLVEEINENFYSVLGIPQDANATTVRKAFRGLSLILHPDKNASPDAEQQFRNLVSIYDVLKDPGKRKRYDEVLENGLPNWKSAVYYYRHVRKMGLAEMSIILFVLISIGQYAVGWATYVEHKMTAESQKKVKLRKLMKKGNKQSKATVESIDLEEDIPKPSVADTLPVQIPKLLWFTFTSLPFIFSSIGSYIFEIGQRKIREREQNTNVTEEINTSVPEPEVRPVRKRKQFTLPERPDSEGTCILDPVDEPHVNHTPTPIVSGGFWSDDDLAELVRLVNKYPPGSSERWERIASIMYRPVAEITHMAAKLKNSSFKIAEETSSVNYAADLSLKKVKTKSNKLDDEEVITSSAWSQLQQKAFENALTKYPKGSVSDRWEKIAKSVPNKTREECMLRYKYLVDLVNKQRLKTESNDSADVPN